MDRCVWSNFSFVIWLVVHPTHIWCTPECTVLTVEERCRSVWWNTVEYQGLNIFVGKVMKALMRVGALTARIRETSRSCVLNCAGPWEARQLVRDTPLYADLYGGLQPRWPLVLRGLQLPHAFYTSMYLEVIAVLYYNNYDGDNHACVLKACISSKYCKCISAIKRILYTTAMYISSSSFVYLCFSLFSAMHV